MPIGLSGCSSPTSGRLEVAVDHARREEDEVLDAAAARVVERVLERAQAVVEGAVRILVRAAGVRDRGEVYDDLRLDLAQNPRERVVVARVLRMERDAGLAEQVEALVDDPEVQVAVRRDSLAGGEVEQVVDLQAVDDLDPRAAGDEASARLWPMKPAPPMIATLPARKSSIAHDASLRSSAATSSPM